jgi:hypothetical protein
MAVVSGRCDPPINPIPERSKESIRRLLQDYIDPEKPADVPAMDLHPIPINAF